MLRFKAGIRITVVFLSFLLSAAVAEQLQPSLHGIYSEKLRTIMQRMNLLVYEREMTALQVQETRNETLQQLINTVAELVKASEGLTDAIPGIELSTEDRVVFRAMANQLFREAQTLGVMVDEKNYPAVDSAYQRLNETCNACHSLFRF